jgi:hypothetical protein
MTTADEKGVDGFNAASAVFAGCGGVGVLAECMGYRVQDAGAGSSRLGISETGFTIV